MKQLEQLIRTHSTPQNKVRRAKIILLVNEEAMSNKEISQEMGVDQSDVTKWTRRWIERASEPLEERISDLPRPGTPARITPEQWCQIMALACEPPEAHGRPITHWTHKELAEEIVKQGLAESISASHVGNFLKKQTCNPTAVDTG